MPEAAKKSSPVLMPDRMGLSEHKRQDWVVDIPIGVTLEQAMEPSYWAHVAEQMNPLDHIEIRAEDGSYVAELIVSMCERSYARVVLDRVVRLTQEKEAPVESIKHRVEWKGPAMKWCVIRNSDNQVLRQEERTKDEAMRWLDDHEKTMRV